MQTCLPLSAEHLQVFRRAAALLTSSLELEQALANTIDTCLPALGDFGFFDVRIEQEVRRTARAFQNIPLEEQLKQTRWVQQDTTDINLCALSSGESVLHANTDDAWFRNAFGDVPRQLAFGSMISVPVRMGDELIGSLTLFMGESDRRHTQADLDFAAELAGLAAPVVVNARLLERQRQSREALRISEERLRAATDAAKIGIWDWDIVNDRINWSDKVYELHGLKPGEFGGRVADYAQLLHPEDRERSRAKIQAAVASGDFFSNEFRSLWPDGSQHWLSTWAHVYRDESGRAVRMVGSSIDITGQKTKEAGLSSRNSQLEEEVISSTSERDRIWRMSQDILAVASLNGYLRSVNPSMTRILGWSEDEVLSIPYIELVHPDMREQVQQMLQLLGQGLAQEGVEVCCLHKDGSSRWLSWAIVPADDVLYAVGRDITELRRQRELVLSASEKRLQLALEVGGMGAWQWDMRSGQVTWWPGMEALHGLPPGEYMRQVEDYLAFVHPEDVEIVKNSLSRSQDGRSRSGTEYRIIWPDGSIHWIEGRGELFLDDKGEPIQMAGVCVDMTNRKLTEQNLRFIAGASAALAELVDSELMLKKVAQIAVPAFADWCAVDLLDEAGNLRRLAVAHVSPEKARWGYELHKRYPPDPTRAGGPWQVIRTAKAELVAEITDEMLVNSIEDPEYLQIIRELGLRSYIGAPLIVRGKVLGVITFISAESGRLYRPEDAALAEDIGRRAAVAIENSRLYRSLKENDRRKDDFLAMLAHELRNPLAPIAAAAEILKAPVGPEQLRKTSELVGRQVKHMTELVDDLLDVSRVTQGKIELERSAVDLNEMLLTAVEQVRPLLEKRSHTLELALDDGPCYVYGDEKRLIQVVANLLNNAAKYTPEGGSVRLGVTKRGGDFEIVVSDNGIGMAPELVACAFELFVQGKRAADRAQGGLGLGLALAKSLVELHGGSIQAQSDGVGRGSQFALRIPCMASVPYESRQESTSMASPAVSHRILVVDDNQDAAEMLVLFLDVLGQQTAMVNNPLEALERAEAEAFDVILLDIGLPVMDGFELARQLRARLGDQTPKLIAISGYGREQDREAARVAGIDHYLVKPVDTALLMNLLNKP